ncbi:hypothetical protein F5Y11DRAFT_336192 [Daldinia sp. FL1419]|nr:hypothetical protein F5Y11DRAFT_336192 [Daldinia sp. FL1419]
MYHLNSRKDYPYWIACVQWTASTLKIWHLINPENYDESARPNGEAEAQDEVPTWESVRQKEINRIKAEVAASRDDGSPHEPVTDADITMPTKQAINELHDRAHRDFVMAQAMAAANMRAMNEMSRYIQETVNSKILLFIILECTAQDRTTVADLLYKIKLYFKPTTLSATMRLREETLPCTDPKSRPH